MYGEAAGPDPAGMAAADFSNPQTLNRYAYALNAPTMLTDAYGLDSGGKGYCYFVDPEEPLFERPTDVSDDGGCVPDWMYGGGGWVSLDGGMVPPNLLGSGDSYIVCPSGDWYCVLDQTGAVIEEDRVRTNEAGFRYRFTRTAARVVVEAGTHSPWAGGPLKPGFGLSGAIRKPKLRPCPRD